MGTLAAGGRRTRVGMVALSFLGARADAQVLSEYTVRFDPADSPPALRITLHAEGLAPVDGAWSLVLDGWGNWPEMEGDYVRVVSASPALGERRVTLFPVEPGPDWDGRLDVSFTVPLLPIGTGMQQRYSVLPASDGVSAIAAIANTIPFLAHGGEPVEGRRDIRIEGPEGSEVFTGWAGGGADAAGSALPPIGENAVYAIGRPVEVLRADAGATPIEVYQFSPGAGACARVLDVTRAFVERMSMELGHAPPEPVRVCISPTTGGGFLTDHGLVVGFPPGTPEWQLDSPYFRHLVCHELCHIWIGRLLREADAESTVWFKEGFTDYLSLWGAAASGVVSREWFVTRLLELEAGARESSLGKVAFADPSVEWRDGDGPNETMAYKGGAVLAFALDAELRRAGTPGLPQLLREMLERGGGMYTTESIRGLLRARGLEVFERRFVGGTEAPDVRRALLSLRYAERETPVRLAYLGLRVEPGEMFGRVGAIDPDGPAAGAGFLVGDIVGGYAPARSGPVEITSAVTTEFRFGLAQLEPGEGPASVWVHRGGEPIEIRVEPRLIDGGLRRELAPTAESDRLLFPAG
ncbi:MAG: hypothetical protein IPJ41_05400 [Phycisphaerales bacterium]|nr:hypothetical protein [Phycisphaerales bacterium]